MVEKTQLFPPVKIGPNDGLAPDNIPAIVHLYHLRQAVERRTGETLAQPWKTGKRSDGGIWIPKSEDRPKSHASRWVRMMGLTAIDHVCATVKPLDAYQQKPKTCDVCYGCRWLAGAVQEPLVVVASRNKDATKVRKCPTCNQNGRGEFRDPWAKA